MRAGADETLNDPSTSAKKKASVVTALHAADGAIDAAVLQVRGDLLEELSELPKGDSLAAGAASEKVERDTEVLAEVTKQVLTAFQNDVIKTARASFKTEWGEDAYASVYAADGDVPP